MSPLVSLLCSNKFIEQNITLILVFVLLIIFSAFFASCETACSTANIIRIKNLADDNVKGSRKALQICENYDKTLTTVLVVNNLVNIAATTLAAYVFSNLISNPTLSNILNTIIVTIVILIFGEILPKSLSKVNPEKFLLKYSKILGFVILIFYPVTFLFLKLQSKFVKNAKKHTKLMPTVTEDELESIIDTMEEEGVINSEDASLIQGVLDLGEKSAYDIMTPRIDISAIEINDTPQKALEMFINTNYSRLPVYKGDIDHIIGILNFKDFFKFYFENDGKVNISKILTKPLYLNENVNVDDIIRSMQKVKKHLAVVLDEHGGTSGIVCLEDAIEEMVGEIYDEHDEVKSQSLFTKIDDHTFIVDAEIELDDLFEKLEIENLPDSEYKTLSGFLYELSETIPQTNQVLKFTTIDEKIDKSGNYIEKVVRMYFTLKVVEENRIKQVLIKIV